MLRNESGQDIEVNLQRITALILSEDIEEGRESWRMTTVRQGRNIWRQQKEEKRASAGIHLCGLRIMLLQAIEDDLALRFQVHRLEGWRRWGTITGHSITARQDKTNSSKPQPIMKTVQITTVFMD